jgi:hypothetical protein
MYLLLGELAICRLEVLNTKVSSKLRIKVFEKIAPWPNVDLFSTPMDGASDDKVEIATPLAQDDVEDYPEGGLKAWVVLCGVCGIFTTDRAGVDLFRRQCRVSLRHLAT